MRLLLKTILLMNHFLKREIVYNRIQMYVSYIKNKSVLSCHIYYPWKYSRFCDVVYQNTKVVETFHNKIFFI